MSGGLTKSPDGLHEAELIYAGEIPFGPEYFNLLIDGRSFGSRLFGHGLLWSPDSTIVVLTEWHTSDREKGPITSLLLIRPADWTYSRFPIIEKGFATADYFVGDSLVLRHSDRQYTGGSYVVQCETDLATIGDWTPLPVAGTSPDR
jgi:hypothetical protein